jgi:CBS domain-containing protein
MAQLVRDLMAEPITVRATTTLTEAARLMRDADIGDVIVMDAKRPVGMLTDRDIVVRGIAEEQEPKDTTVGEICSMGVIAIGPADNIDQAVALMRRAAVRRLPVVEADQLVGVVSLGELAIDRDENSVLAEISVAEPNSP